MGKRDRQARRRSAHHQGRTTSPGAAPPPGGPASTDEGLALLAEALLRGKDRLADRFVSALVTAPDLGAAVDRALAAGVGRTWEGGWQVADLVHSTGRKLAAPDRRLLVRTVVAAASAWRHLASADPDWVRQVEEVESDSAPADRGGVFVAWSGDERLDVVDALLRAAALLGRLWQTPRLPAIGDPPSAWGRPDRAGAPAGRRAAPPAGVDERILGRIRGLLAKAESTEFAPEAEALSAKAQELMTRYAIDHAVVAGAPGGGAGGEQPVSRRVLIHDPYAKGKSTLLSQVARANRCKTIWFAEVGFTTIVGFPTDVALVDLLFTSLVTQCSTAMQVASRDLARPRAFRESFTLAFALRIGERLERAAAATVADVVAERGDDLLPVLASRDAEVERAFDEAFPHRRTSSVRVSDGRGWAAGRAAADVASIAGATGALEG